MSFTAFNWLATGVVLLEPSGRIHYINEAAQSLLRSVGADPGATVLGQLFTNGFLIENLVNDALSGQFDVRRQTLHLDRLGLPTWALECTVSLLPGADTLVLLELSEHEQRQRFEREEHLVEAASANRELVRSLAHEIKNPLGGIRGAAQLLESELPAPELREYTQVIIKESDRLQQLLDRLLEPHRQVQSLGQVNIHEVCERVRSVILAEFPKQLEIIRDYDASIPELTADKEQLIQVVMNLARNAVQALQGEGRIVFRTRIARRAVILRRQYKLALQLHVIDNGPGIAPQIKDRLFFPLVSGRDGGSGLGLSLAQSFVQQHGGSIEVDSVPGKTDFRVMLPLLA
jgi:two-component system, NtrC family, nitrogen regulation sensor histidine kinase GlnL